MGRAKLQLWIYFQDSSIAGLNKTLGEKNASENSFKKFGTSFFLALYVQGKQKCMADARYDIFRKKKKTPELKTLLPTEANVTLHTKRAHLQMMLWKSAD